MHDTTGWGQGTSRLLAAAIDGNEQAFDSLFGPLVEPGYRLALVMLRRPQEAEDAIQEAVLKAWQHLRRLRDGDAVRTWFLSIVANECRSRRRSRWWRHLPLPELEVHPDRSDLIEESVVRSADLARAFSRLGQEDRLVLHLFYAMDLPLEEVAQTLGTSIPAARSRLYRAVKRLRPDLELTEVLS